MKFLQGDFDAAFAAARKAIDATGYGRWVSDDKVAAVVDEALKAIEERRTESERKGDSKKES